jgi:hypothetical protein
MHNTGDPRLRIIQPATGGALMGTLKYDGVTTEFDDRTLAHIEIVIVRKLRKQESFFMSWHEPGAGGGRNGIWVHPTAMLTFHFAFTGAPDIDKAWLERLTVSANSPSGLFITDSDGKPLPSAENTDL